MYTYNSSNFNQMRVSLNKSASQMSNMSMDIDHTRGE